MAASAADRDARAAEIARALFDAAPDSAPLPSAEEQADLDAVVACRTRGFREILLTVVIARLLDPSFRSTSLYSCNPRALYEGPIRAELDARRIPRGKSGPLNIAKATQALDGTWAAQRRPKAVATQVVRLATRVDQMSRAELMAFGSALAAGLLREARRMAELDVVLQPEEDPVALAELVTNMIVQTPDGGNTPQRIVGLLLDTRERATGSSAEVLGLDDSASVTSTTAKKLGDLALQLPDGTVAAPMEVTVKPFTEARAMEAAESAHEYAAANETQVMEILVVCRPEDIHPDARGADSSALMGVYEKDGVVFYFINVFDWVLAQLLEMPARARIEFHARVDEYVRRPSTSETVKRAWRELHAEDG